MSRQSNREEVTMRYLLGSLSEEERARLEEGYFSDDEAFEELEIAEDELIDRYVRGELSNDDRDRFEATVAGSSRLTERVHFARVWKEKLAASGVQSSVPSERRETDRRPASWWSNLFDFSPASRAPRLAVAFSILLVLIGGIALLAGWLRLREESRRLAAQQLTLEQRQRELDKQAADLKSQTDELANQIRTRPSPSEAPQQIEKPIPESNKTFVALTLSPGSIRGGGGTNVLLIPPARREVQITLNLRDTDYSSYQATVRTVDGVPLFSSDGLLPKRRRSGDVLVFRVPAKHLATGQFIIHLEGMTQAGLSESVDDYVFSVVQVK